VKKEAYAGVGQPTPEQLGNEQQLVVVNPDEIARPVVFSNHVGEALVHADVRLPVAYMQRDLIQQVMEQGPQDAVGKSFVIPCYLVRCERHTHQPHGDKLLVQRCSLFRRELVLRRTGPADPEPAGLFVRPQQSGSQPT